MAITKSGIDPTEVLNLLTKIDEYKTKMNDVYSYIQTDVHKEMDAAYGGEAANALMKNTDQLMTNCEEALDTIIKTVATNINGDLDDAKATDQNLAG